MRLNYHDSGKCDMWNTIFFYGWLLSGLSIWHHVVPLAHYSSVPVTSPKTVSPSTIIPCRNKLQVMPPFQRHWVTSASHATQRSFSLPPPSSNATAKADPNSIQSVSITPRPDVSAGILRLHYSAPLGMPVSVLNCTHTTLSEL